MTTPNNTVAGLAEKLTKLVTRLRDGGWNMRTPEELAEAVADAIMEALASPAPSAGVGVEAVVREVVAEIDIYADTDPEAGQLHRRALSWAGRLNRALQHPAAPIVSPSVAGDAGELPEPRIRVQFNSSGQIRHGSPAMNLSTEPLYDADQMRAYGEQCRRLATAEQPGRVVGARTIDGVHVIIAKPFTEGVQEQLLVRYDDYLEAVKPGSAVQGENREQEAAALGNILRRFSAELSLHERASLTIAVQVLSGTTPPPAATPRVEEGHVIPQWEIDLWAAEDRMRGIHGTSVVNGERRITEDGLRLLAASHRGGLVRDMPKGSKAGCSCCGETSARIITIEGLPVCEGCWTGITMDATPGASEDNATRAPAAEQGWGPSYKQPWQAKEDDVQAEAHGVEGMVPAISPNGSDDDMLAYLDKLLTVQGQLMFARENYDEEAAETFGVTILDFMRLYGMRLRAKLAAAPSGVEEKYNELILAVGMKHHGESRHETALRYIRSAEDNGGSDTAALAGKDGVK